MRMAALVGVVLCLGVSAGEARPRNSGWTNGTIVGHPAGCPHRAFCGCGASVEVFGHPIRDLWLAESWFKFPKVAPAAGMVAVRRGHVFVLRSHIGGNIWLVFDANSGGHHTRVHHRSISGLTIVNPHA